MDIHEHTKQRQFNPFKHLRYYAMGLLTTAILAQCYNIIMCQARRLEKTVYKKLVRESIPKLIPCRYEIPRNNDELLYWFIQCNLQSDTEKQFGIVLGPTGTGKTSIVRKLCNNMPKGILYYEVAEPLNFTNKLAKELGMKIAPSNLLDIVLGYFSTTYTMHYCLPSGQKQALDMIVETLRSAGMKLKATHGMLPTLFIDGADLLAKFEKDLFVHLLMQAKLLANDGCATIVLVSSEGTIMPIIHGISGMSRCNKIFEVTDTDDEQAVQYLIKMGFSNELSNKFIQYAGGRCIHLANSVTLHHNYTALNPHIEDHELYNKMIGDLFVSTDNARY